MISITLVRAWKHPLEQGACHSIGDTLNFEQTSHEVGAHDNSLTVFGTKMWLLTAGDQAILVRTLPKSD